MSRLMSITNLRLMPLFCCCCAAAAEPAITATPQPGSSLGASLRHEADNAKRLAADWLADRQRPDGSWGSAARNTELTPAAWLALKGMGNAVDAVARDRAVVWFADQPLDADTSFDACVWRYLMMSTALPDTPEREAQLDALIRTMLPLAPYGATYSRWLWEDLTFPTVPTTMVPLSVFAKRQLALIAPDYPIVTQNTETLWHFARLINRHAKGVWMRGTEALDWRNDFARALISGQRKDPRGGGYWDSPALSADNTPDDARIRATAFALLALLEID